MWHGQFLLLPKLKPERPADVYGHGLASRRCGAYRRGARALRHEADQGRRRRQAASATAAAPPRLREASRALAAGATVAMTADVPPGPARRAGEGIATLASLSGRPVVPFAIATRPFLPLPTWSAFTVNLPFSTLAIVIGDPVRVPPSSDTDTIETGRLAIEGALAESDRARLCAGRSDATP